MLDTVTIPVDDSRIQNRFTGYAIANPGTENVNIRIVLVNGDGVQVQTIRPPSLNPLAPGGHSASFIWQDLNNQNLEFSGSMVFISDGGFQFSMVALVLDRGLITAVPAISGKAPGVGN